MLCTVVWETYTWDERKDVWDALRTLIPRASERWSLKGLYAYWDPATHEMLYTGLASDLPNRFAQHNGLVRHSGGNKFAKIRAWFEDHERLGLSVMLQAAGVVLQDEINELDPTLGATSGDVIKGAEGQVIELHRLERGTWPPWNGVGGSTRGQQWASTSARSLIQILTAETDSLFVAREALRDLAADDAAQVHEVTIHGGRIRALQVSQQLGMLPMQVPAEDMMDFVLRLFMLQAGHLVDDLSASDNEIIDRLRQIEDGRVLSEYVAMRESLEEMIPVLTEPGEREAASVQMISAIRAEVEHPARAAEVRDLFESGYLARTPRLARR